MNLASRQLYWTNFLKDFGEQNRGRVSRLGVFEGENDYWLENGLPFTGIDVDTRRQMPTVEVMLAGFTHTVKNVRNVKVHLSLEGDEDGVDIADTEGRVTILRFEK